MMDPIDQTFVDIVITFAAARFPTGEAAAGAVKTESGRILTSVYVEAAVDTAHLCSETGAICEAHKLAERVVASICVYRKTPDDAFLVVPPCGICQERLAFWGLDVRVAVPAQQSGKIWVSRPLRDLHPYDWSQVFGEAPGKESPGAAAEEKK